LREWDKKARDKVHGNGREVKKKKIEGASAKEVKKSRGRAGKEHNKKRKNARARAEGVPIGRK